MNPQKLLSPSAYVRKVRSVLFQAREQYYDRKYRIHSYNIDEEISKTKNTYKKLELDYDAAVALTEHVRAEFPEYFEQDENKSCFSEHYTLFAAFSALPVKRILELGTYNGEFTFFLSRIFPDAEIVTVDLPDSDPVFCATYGRDEVEARKNFIEKRNHRLASNRITFIQRNSFFLPSLGLKKFDCIWVDASHIFPAVAWDVCNAYHLLNDNCFMAFDDIFIPEKKKVPLWNHIDAYDGGEALSVLNDGAWGSLNFILKRFSPDWSANQRRRKYIAVFQKKPCVFD
ncbi:class I SAM-dependent methyltransferase [uncultured Desulfovibrio sp.]|uniref:class I SAM-dependent methyltransferase n=1 Tax=uncultured Desulfovibrio sp. TaxID=167968 RepID=UPI002611AA4A|nr:class I SAM-dependent methyltransferase [uncultured Desulfovibrio sp.]